MKAPEDYENLAEGFNDVFTEINQLIDNPKITINGEIYTLVFYLCCDYKVCVCMYVAIFNICSLQLPFRHYTTSCMHIPFLDAVGNAGTKKGKCHLCLCVVQCCKRPKVVHFV